MSRSKPLFVVLSCFLAFSMSFTALVMAAGTTHTYSEACGAIDNGESGCGCGGGCSRSDGKSQTCNGNASTGRNGAGSCGCDCELLFED